MKPTRRPMLTTIIYGLLCGVSFIPLVMTMNYFLNWSVAFRLTIWVLLAGYLLILTRWAKVNLISTLYPLLLLLMLVFWGDTNSAFLFLALGILSWLRSGVCFQGGLLKSVAAEIFLCLGGGALAGSFTPHSTITWALSIWLFFLVQSLYFVVFRNSVEAQEERVELDPFERARGQVERILSTGPQ